MFRRRTRPPEKQKAHYEATKSKYQEVKAKLIYIPFGGGGEDEAQLVRQHPAKGCGEHGGQAPRFFM